MIRSCQCQIPRVLCKFGTINQISIGWAKIYDWQIYQFEIQAIDLLFIKKNQTKTAGYLHCGFRLINRIIHRCTDRGLARRGQKLFTIEHISLDEKAF